MAAPVVTSPRNPNVSGALNQEGRGATTVRRQVGIYTGDAASSRPLPVGSPLSAHLVPAQQQQQPSSLPRFLHLQTHTFTSKPGCPCRCEWSWRSRSWWWSWRCSVPPSAPATGSPHSTDPSSANVLALMLCTNPANPRPWRPCARWLSRRAPSGSLEPRRNEPLRWQHITCGEREEEEEEESSSVTASNSHPLTFPAP
ncbi:hypothetical protein O3P69_003929 [Scylla paramamosain]|uniref:Uncharacterized protein n=1 Tax=Scylla paramamosain TaxID=85552 RepID=A0AAW0UHR1_SCYPA